MKNNKIGNGFWTCKVDRITGEYLSIKRFWTLETALKGITDYGKWEIIDIDSKKVVKRIESNTCKIS
jgi:hypothetical protein